MGRANGKSRSAPRFRLSRQLSEVETGAARSARLLGRIF